MSVVLVPVRQATASAFSRHRSLIRHVQRAGLAAGRSHRRDAVALVLAAATDTTWHPESLTLWTRPAVNRFLTCDLRNWCSMNRCLMPDGIPEVVWDLLDVLHHTGQLDPGSDDLTHLREPLICYGGLGFDGHPRPPAEPPIPCACYFPVGEEPPDPHWREADGRRVF